MKQYFHAVALTFVLMSVAPLAMAQCDSGETVIRFSHETNTDRHPKGIAATELAIRVNREMNGMACMQVYPLAALHGEDSIVNALANGDVEMAAPSLRRLTAVHRGFEIFDLPFLFPDIAALDRFQQSASGRELMNAMAAKGLQGLGWWHNGMQQLATAADVSGPQQAGALTLAMAVSDSARQQMQAIGLKTVSVHPDRQYEALAAARIDAVSATWRDLQNRRLYEVPGQVVQSNHAIDGYLVVASAKLWGGLTDAGRKKLFEIVWSLSKERNRQAMAAQRRARDLILNAGSKIRILSAAQRRQWADALAPVWQRWQEQGGSELLRAALAAGQ